MPYGAAAPPSEPMTKSPYPFPPTSFVASLFPQLAFGLTFSLCNTRKEREKIEMDREFRGFKKTEILVLGLGRGLGLMWGLGLIPQIISDLYDRSRINVCVFFSLVVEKSHFLVNISQKSAFSQLPRRVGVC